MTIKWVIGDQYTFGISFIVKMISTGYIDC